MVEKHGMVHLSAGDLLRAERNREGSEFGSGDEKKYKRVKGAKKSSPSGVLWPLRRS